MLKHDYCSPSKLALRYHCPGSVNLEKELIGTGEQEVSLSQAASEGTRKHEIISHILQGKMPIDSAPDDVATAYAATTEILSELRETNGYLEICEYQVDLSPLGISGGTEGCRCDLIAVVPGYRAVLIDFKFGIGRVEAPRYNWQMKAYAWAVWKAFGVTELLSVIIQPNTDEEYMLKMDCFNSGELEEIGPVIKEIVDKANGFDAPIVRGNHCTQYFCRCKEVCPAWRDSYLAMPEHLTIAAHLKQISPEKRQELYENVIAADAWISKARATIETMAIAGDIEITGWEVGAGRKTREWGKPEIEIELSLRELMSETDKTINIYHPQELLSPAEVEKEFGKLKKVKEKIEPLLIFKMGKPKLFRSEPPKRTTYWK